MGSLGLREINKKFIFLLTLNIPSSILILKKKKLKINPTKNFFDTFIQFSSLKNIETVCLRPMYNKLTIEVEYSGGGVLIFSYLILIHELDDLGGL